MKKIVAAFLLLVTVTSFAAHTSRVVYLSAQPLVSTYNSTFPQLIMSALSFKNSWSASNTSAQTVCCNTERVSYVSAPTTTSNNELCVASNSVQTFEKQGAIKNVFCRSVSQTASSGILILNAW